MIDDFVMSKLSDPDNLKTFSEDKELKGIFEDLKGPVVNFLLMPSSQQIEYLLELLKRKVNATLGDGIERFERLLNAVQYGGKVHTKIKDVMLELSQVRNILVHRNGEVDSRFKKKCPWVDVSVGEQISITDDKLDLYLNVCRWYVVEFAARDGIQEAELKAYQDELFKKINEKKTIYQPDIQKIAEELRAGKRQRSLV
ncbi:hypothetical protein [Paenibacillus albiflavus]|nr:hypothetical protein [Paenibacillus albiflavus]